MKFAAFMKPVICLYLFAGILSLAQASYQNDYFQGVNYLQTAEVSLNSFSSMQSLRAIKDNGANTVALIVFMQQNASGSSEIRHSSAVTDKQIVQAITDAHDIGLRVILKPQVLVTGSWAGEIRPTSQSGWQEWFESYQGLLQHYARMAQKYAVEMLVIGTELRHAAMQPQFRQLIIEVRKIFTGELSYAAHGIAGMKQFPYWELLDSVSLTLYPPLGKDWSIKHIHQVMAEKTRELEAFAAATDKPLWIAEIGLSSTQGSFRHPWLVTGDQQVVADTQRQAQVLGMWLQHLRQPWVYGVMIWSWSSNIDQDGVTDTGFDIQNKAAEKLVSCYWRNKCQGAPDTQ